MRYPTIFHLISAISTQTNAHCVLIGGFAVNHYKVTRQTADVDFLITQDDFKKMLTLLESQGYKLDYSQEVFARLRGNRLYLMDLDFMFIDKETLDKIIHDGKEINIAGQKFLVPSLMHLIALKLHSLKSNLKIREYKDLPDIVALITANRLKASSKEFKELCLKYGTEDLYHKILERL